MTLNLGFLLMLEGVVKWYNMKKGYGFIQSEGAEKDIFIHVTTLQKSGLKKLLEGQAVIFDVDNENERPAAINVALK